MAVAVRQSLSIGGESVLECLAAAAAAVVVTAAAAVSVAVVAAAATEDENKNDDAAAAAVVITEEIHTFASFRLHYILLRRRHCVHKKYRPI